MNILAVYWNIRQCNAETIQFHKYRWIYNGHGKYVFGEILLTASVAVFLKTNRAGEGISEPLSDILYNMLSDELFKHPATQIESLVLSCR